MSGTKFGFQTYTWQMSYDRYREALGDILAVIRQAGGAGVEPEVCMLGPYTREPERLAEDLAGQGLELGALCYVADWRHSRETEQEWEEAQEVLDYLGHFPDTLLALCQMPGPDREALRERQDNALACVKAVAQRAADRGLGCGFHPNSPPGSIFRTREDYAVLLEGLATSVCGFIPDSGHMLKGGMDPLEILREYRPLVRHLHFKDLDTGGQWVEMGQGVTDFPALVGYLSDTDYQGWIMVEDESPRAEKDPNSVTIENGAHLKQFSKGTTE